jgi:hypothetical protein
VSKLCCPVCWELLGILNEDEPRLSFRGCHSIVYPVELPKWLPSQIVDNLTERFQVHLRKELDFMVREFERDEAVMRKKNHASHESESSISVASTTRRGDGGIEYRQYGE